MADVFISYSREDQARARAIADALEARGLSVWWDTRATPGVPFDEEIETQLASSRCALVLWSSHSTASAWVKNEAATAAERGILLPVLLEPVRLPLAFRHLHAADLGTAVSVEDCADWKLLVERIAALMQPARAESAGGGEAGEEPLPASVVANHAGTSPIRGELEAVTGKLTGTRWPIHAADGTIVIGRTVADGFAIDDVTVSRKHAEIHVSKKGVVLNDAGSTSGTFVNAVPIRSCLLRDGDLLRLGSAVLRFRARASKSKRLRYQALTGVTGDSPMPARALSDSLLDVHMVVCWSTPAEEVAAEIAIHCAIEFLQETNRNPNATWPFAYDPDLSHEGNRLRASLSAAHSRMVKAAQPGEALSVGDVVAALTRDSIIYVSGLGQAQAYLFRRRAEPALLFDLRRGLVSEHETRSNDADDQNTGSRLGVDASRLDVKVWTLGDGDLVLLTSRRVDEVATAVLKGTLSDNSESLETAAARVRDVANAIGCEPFSFVIIGAAH
jgi:hypothetical protein